MFFVKFIWFFVWSVGLFVVLIKLLVFFQVDGGWIVFDFLFYNFVLYIFENGLLDGLIIVNWLMGLNWQVDVVNVKFNNGYFEFWVFGVQNFLVGIRYFGVEVDIVVKNIVYGSFCIVVILIQIFGVCNGKFMFVFVIVCYIVSELLLIVVLFRNVYIL